MSQIFRRAAIIVTAARRDAVDTILNEIWQWADPGTSSFSKALAPNAQAPATHYALYDAALPIEILEEWSLMTDGILPDAAWGQGNLPSQAAAIAATAAGQLDIYVATNGADSWEHLNGVIGGRNLVEVEE
jgi:hypothetical protein